mmetsp:Transcript_6851/g.21240  ORF Transcript_6851/g.21240 Transcript_6851/m.21240 type:complete len:127 (-) Transcript_6851:291-671(-)
MGSSSSSHFHVMYRNTRVFRKPLRRTHRRCSPRRRTIMQEQDEGLEQLDGAVDRVHRMAQEIHGELKTQGNLLEDLENEIDETSEKMNFVMGKLAKLLKTKDNCQLWTIIILTVLFLVMVLVLIWS